MLFSDRAGWTTLSDDPIDFDPGITHAGSIPILISDARMRSGNQD